MKKGIHPDYHEITVIMTDGTKFQTRSTYGKKGDELRLDVDPKTHQAWTGNIEVKNQGRVADFNKRFGGLGNVTKASAQAAGKKEDKAPKKKAEDKKDSASA
ncbi:MAG: 50S ribosomal protein L31 [Proteobacteria bacterium]|nr:50S ribosomal protein L31 [Pseudomonadota bacterium]